MNSSTAPDPPRRSRRRLSQRRLPGRRGNPRPAQADPGVLAAFCPAEGQPGQPRSAAGPGHGRAGGIPPPAPAGQHHARDPQAPGPAQPRQRPAGGSGRRGGPAALGGGRPCPAAPRGRHDVRARRGLVRGHRGHQRARNCPGPGPRHPDFRGGALPAVRAPLELHRRAVPRSGFRRAAGRCGHHGQGLGGGAPHAVPRRGHRGCRAGAVAR